MEETITLKWSPLKKIFFFFIFFYSVLYTFPPPFISRNGVFSYFNRIPDALTMFVGKNILHIYDLQKIKITGSGDTTFDYVRVLTFFLLAFVLAIIVFIVGRKKPNYSKLFYLLYVSVRYYLAIYIIFYGFAKVFKSQFQFPPLYILEERYGNSSPMGLLWNFMGYSTAYTIFAGIGEVLAGVLLLFRRTLIVGAFLSLVVMVNVTAMNFCYDVPVKLFSLHLVLFSIFILVPHAKNLYLFLIHRKNPTLEDFAMPFKTRWVKITRVVLKTIVFIIVGCVAYFCYAEMKQYGDDSSLPPLYGIYKTQLFVRDNDTIPPLATDSLRWSRLIIDRRLTRIDFMTEKSKYQKLEVDTFNRSMDFESYINGSPSNYFTYKLNKDTLIMYGVWDNYHINVKLTKLDLNQFLLVSRGFHWINEYPFNR